MTSECETPSISCSKINDDEQQLIKLSLKKPKKWNWMLTTSKSSSNIAFPTIQLYDDSNKKLLAVTNEANFMADSKVCKSASVSKASSTRQKKNDSFTSVKVKNDPITIHTEQNEDESDENHPITINHDPNQQNDTTKLQLKNHSRSSSVRSRSSILKRIREFTELNRDSSSDGDDDDDDDNDERDDERSNNNNRSKESLKKKYSIRASHIGALLVPKDSFSKVSRRRQRRKSVDDTSTDNVTAINNSSTLAHSPRIIDVQDISKISLETQKYLKDVQNSSPSSDEVFLLLVKRLASLQQHNNLKSLQQTKEIRNCRRERDRNSEDKKSNESSEQNDKRNILEPASDDHCINDKISTSTRTEKIMGSNVSSGKGLSGRRTQSQNNIDNKSSSITNGICCSTKYSKSKRKNSNISAQDFDKKPFSNNNTGEQNFDGIGQIIAANSNVTTITKPKKLNQGKSRDKEKDKDKKKIIHGSLPNHLDTDIDYEGSDDTNSSTHGHRVKFDPINRIVTQNPPPLQQVNDQCYDQGYGSERSPEDEVLPPLPQITDQYNTMVVNSLPQAMLHNSNQLFDMDYQQKFQQQSIQQSYDFITEDCTFNVEIVKGLGGLGLSVSGGIDSSDPYPGLIRIKRLFPHQAAWMTGQLQQGDVLLEANGIILTGLTNNEALEVLRTMGNVVNLLVCRPHDENFRKLSTTNLEVPVPPLRSSFNIKHQQYTNQFELSPGEFEIMLVKQQGSLGFTLQKEDESIEGHFVRALVREPATSDGRIQAGDKIVAVNDIPISNMTHEQAVIFLRQSPDTVKLRLYRFYDGKDATSPTDSNYKAHHDSNGTMKRSKLRPEAISLISDLATKKNTQSSSDGNSENSSSFQSSTNTMSSPRRLRKNNNNNSKCGAMAYDTDNLCDSSSNISTNINQTYTISSSDNACATGGGTSSGTHTPFSDSSADTLTIISQQRVKYYDPHELPADDDETNDGFYDSDELESLEHDNECSSSDISKIKRPESLNIKRCGHTGDSGSTPLASHSVLDAPTTTYRMDNNDDDDTIDGHAMSFTSLPCETLLLACKTENDLRKSPLNDTDTCLYVTKFNKNQPLYQSAQVQINHKAHPDDINAEMNLLKWKGVTMSQQQQQYEANDDNDDDKCSIISSQREDMPIATNTLRVSIRNAQKDIHLDEMGIDSNINRIITIEMNRRWSCRLGIRLESQQLIPNDGCDEGGKSITVIKEICKDTLAEKDGRLRVGDRVLMINDEIVDSYSTQEIIDMMRIIRGSLSITVARKID
ncbi:uncharacterized protein [Chironomus tepperi]|uniref:uncharacterized protein isoform X2 n=1 Tax=Chironomus tepperi TaxID=113505 RepID=UPI00391EFBE9